jgi:hypothetical protein
MATENSHAHQHGRGVMAKPRSKHGLGGFGKAQGSRRERDLRPVRKAAPRKLTINAKKVNKMANGDRNKRRIPCAIPPDIARPPISSEVSNRTAQANLNEVGAA